MRFSLYDDDYCDKFPAGLHTDLGFFSSHLAKLSTY